MLSGKSDIVILLIVTTILILLLATFVISLIYLYQKSQLLSLQKINTLNLTHEKNLLATQLEVQKSTFQHISREIHDNIGHSLTLTKLQLNTLNLLDQTDTKNKIATSIGMISETIEDLRDLSKSVSADLIKALGLITAIERQIEKVNLLGLFTVEMEIVGERVFMELEKEILILRIIQESLSNIIRHAGAKFIKLTLLYYDKQVDLIIKDDGKGFDHPFPENRLKGAGLNNINERIKLLNGKASIFSEPGQGTCIHLSIPYHL